MMLLPWPTTLSRPGTGCSTTGLQSEGRRQKAPDALDSGSFSDPGRGKVKGVVHPAEVPPDVQLTLRLVARDESALAEAYDLHSGAVYGLLLRLLGQASAQEVLQDVFLRLWEAPERYDPARAALRSFLLVMARSRALDRLRQERGEWRLYDEEGQDFPLADEHQDPFAQAASAQRRERLDQAMSQLSEAQRETVRRAFLLGESREETAQQMGVPVGTVKSRLNSALAQLKRVLGTQLAASLDPGEVSAGGAVDWNE
jgi:RNA polymerase sigma-70 factor, ECF subfamily